MMRLTAFGICSIMFLVLSLNVHANNQTAEERIAAIEDAYEIQVEYDEHGALFLSEQLDAIESALAYTGAVFSRRMNKIRVAGCTPRFRIRISKDITQIHPGAIGSYHITTESSTLHLYPSNKYIPSTYDILHEFGHAAAYLSNGQVDVFADFAQINGVYTGVYESDRYVSPYAASNVSEDFAETFSFMLYNGGEAPVAIETHTILYKKYKYIYNFLVAYLGVESRVTQRISEFLSIDAEKETEAVTSN